MERIPAKFAGWWRIVENESRSRRDLDILGPALLSLTGGTDRLRMFVLLADVQARPTKAGVSFTWQGAWEFDEMSGTGSVTLGRDGRLEGKLKIKDGDVSTFVAERASAPGEPIQRPPSYRAKWRR